MDNILIYMIGYEQRSSYVRSKLEFSNAIGILPKENKTLSFEQNLATAKQYDDIIIPEDIIYEKLVSSIVKIYEDTNPKIRINVDVSSMSRAIISAILKNVYNCPMVCSVGLNIIYAPAEYVGAPKETSPFVDFNPILGMEGWSAYPEQPISLVLGLGYESDHAIGAVEYLDPSGTWAFSPLGFDDRYLDDVTSVNSDLNMYVTEFQQIQYELSNPVLLYHELESLITTLAERSRVILAPGGPKLFSAIAMIVKLKVGNQVGVWRASTHDHIDIRDAKAAGDLVNFYFPGWLKEDACSILENPA